MRGIHRSGDRWIPLTKASDAELWCFFYQGLNKRLSKQLWGWWFETPSRPLWRYSNVTDWDESRVGIGHGKGWIQINDSNGRLFKKAAIRIDYLDSSPQYRCHISPSYLSYEKEDIHKWLCKSYKNIHILQIVILLFHDRTDSSLAFQQTHMYIFHFEIHAFAYYQRLIRHRHEKPMQGTNVHHNDQMTEDTKHSHWPTPHTHTLYTHTPISLGNHFTVPIYTRSN